ncbi:hypothetical protein IMSAGC017_01937 [Thomasclavelia cocleata]|uniref:Uncharacterized protein n=1 Tax=Thomasclavelia cocleata TaxID=69824 RepID=A0A829ZBT8_9FIRM|nr:hypothetical protein [Thomasclavelia cocleata]GFI41891.1 hypothetical protein IMSAGC017_01937 [Thomasclavelia cocleata]
MSENETTFNHDKLYNNGKFVKYNPVKDKKFIYTFIKNDCYSNSSNLVTAVNTLTAYEDTVTRSKNYCVYLRVMYPKDLSKNQQHEFIKKFMFEVSLNYKKLLFAYKFVKRGKGHYVDVIAFEREIYTKEREIEETYDRDMYINKNTGRTCSNDDPDAVHRCKKGEVRLDKDGRPIKKKVLVSPKKTRYFNYNSSDDAKVKKANFNSFRLRLCFKASMALSKVSSAYNYFSLKYAKRIYGYSDHRTVNIQYYNDALSEINRQLRQLQQACYLCCGDESAMNKIIYSLAGMNNSKRYKISKNSNCFINIKPTAKINADSTRYREVVNDFKRICMEKILGWYLDEFDYVNEFNWCTEVCGSVKRKVHSPYNWLITHLKMLINSYDLDCPIKKDIDCYISKLSRMKHEKTHLYLDYRSIVKYLQNIIAIETVYKNAGVKDLIAYLDKKIV